MIPEELKRERNELSEKVRALMATANEQAREMVIGELVALLLVAEPPEGREEFRQIFDRMVDGLVTILDDMVKARGRVN